jgi:hypothetical protein
MKRLSIAVLAIAANAMAQGFTFTIGSPVASQDFQLKAAAFVFRTEGCGDPARLVVSATAEGVVKGERRSVALRVFTGTKPGVYAVSQNWPSEGFWVVNLKGACANLSAGAIAPFGPQGFIRDSAKFFPRPAAGSEIEASLEALARGGKQ